MQAWSVGLPQRGLPLLRHVVIDHPELFPLRALDGKDLVSISEIISMKIDSQIQTHLGNDNIPSVPALSINNLETPGLRRGPTIVVRLNIAIDPLLGSLLPVGVEKGIVRRRRDPLCAALDLAKEPVTVIAPFIVKGAILSGALDAARGRLRDVAVGNFGVVFVLLDVQRDGGEPDCLAREPADTLQRETGVRAVREGFVLEDMSISEIHFGVLYK